MILLLTFACSDRLVDLDDDSGGIELFVPQPNDEVASPYVLGGSVRFHLSANRPWGDPATWRVQVDEDAVLLYDWQVDGDVVRFSARFLAPGETTFAVLDLGGDLLDEVVVEVLTPDTVDLFARGHEVVGLDPEAQTSVLVLAGQEAAWEVEFRAEGRSLYGSGALELELPPGFAYELADYSFGSSKDTLLLGVPEQAGSYDLPMRVAGVEVGSLHVDVVEESAIEGLALELPDESQAEDGEQLKVLVRAWTGDDQEVFGLPGAWSIERQTSSEQTGDLFTYSLDRRIENQLIVRLGEGQAVGTIHGLGTVGSSTSCAAAGLPASLLLGLMGLVGLRRRAGR